MGRESSEANSYFKYLLSTLFFKIFVFQVANTLLPGSNNKGILLWFKLTSSTSVVLGNHLFPKYTLEEFTFSTLAYFLMSISFRPFSSNCTVLTASRAMLQAKDDHRLITLVVMELLMMFSIASRLLVSTGILEKRKTGNMLGGSWIVKKSLIYILIANNSSPTGRRRGHLFLRRKLKCYQEVTLSIFCFFSKLTINPSLEGVSNPWIICSLLRQLSS